MIHLYCGDGKGKTTAALGLSLRALGNGVPVVLVQFLKMRGSGEVRTLRSLGAAVFRGKACGSFVSRMTVEERARTKEISDGNLAAALLECARRGAGGRVLLVLDEVCAAWNESLVERGEVVSLVERAKGRGDGMELVLTGRNPPAFMLAAADYVTEMKKLRHPLDGGVPARPGVEF